MEGQNRIGVYMSAQSRKQTLLIQGCGVSHTTVINWIKNRTQPGIFQLHKIAELLGVTMEELIEG